MTSEAITKKLDLLKAILNDGGSFAIAVITAIVSQAMQPLKNGCPYKKGQITKKVTYTVGLNGVYANMVNNQRERENKDADFVPQAAWFKRIFDTNNGSIVAKKSDETCLYLFFVCKNAETHEYFVDGKPATDEETITIKKFKAVSSKSATQGLEEEIIVRTVALDGLTEIHANGVKYEL
jgi:hypothetical protein